VASFVEGIILTKLNKNQIHNKDEGGLYMFRLFSKSSTKSVDVKDIDQLLGKIDLIDIREPNEYRSGHIPTAKNIPMNSILSETEKHLDKQKEYHIICQSGGRSARACGILKEKGYHIINVTGGTGRYSGKLER
jgi:rhodanese-related sulfurtransferase